MSIKIGSKMLWEHLEECVARGRIEDVEIYNGLSNNLIGKFDVYDAEDQYGEMVVMKHRRNRTKVKIWVV